MKPILGIVVVTGAFIWGFLATAAMAEEPPGRPAEGANPPPSASGACTADQKARVASILSRYDAASLTVEDARAINNAFRAAGIRRGPCQPEAIRAAGFNPERIRSLDPPPERPTGKKPSATGPPNDRREAE